MRTGPAPAPSGITQKLEGFETDQFHLIREDSTLGIGERGQQAVSLPRVYSMKQNYPNPFNPQTVITFDLPDNDGHGEVSTRITIFDVRGRVVKVLTLDALEPGRHSVLWDGKTDNGITASSGIYFYRLDAGNFTSTRKMLLVKLGIHIS